MRHNKSGGNSDKINDVYNDAPNGARVTEARPQTKNAPDSSSDVGHPAPSPPPHCRKRRVYGVRPEGNVDPAVDAHGELTSQNVLFKNEAVAQAAQALGVSEDGGFESRW